VDFDAHVRAALESLPPQLREAMSNVEIVVENENRDDPDLFGLYLGIPLTERGAESYAGVLPDPAVLEEEIRITVVHEIAHHFGIDEDRLAELGWD
jgi:predicted Zn-dependent protease with MMP-like domain